MRSEEEIRFRIKQLEESKADARYYAGENAVLNIQRDINALRWVLEEVDNT